MDGPIVEVGDDGRVVYRASALGGGCQKALVAARLEYAAMPPPKEMQDRFDEGHLHEPHVLEKMRREGWTIWGEQETVELQVTGRIVVRGHIDAKGAVDITSHEVKDVQANIVEVKTQSKDEWDGFERNGWDHGFFPGYKWQLSAYMLATKLPAVLVRKNRNSGQIKMEWVDEPFYSLVDIRKRVLEIEALASEGLPNECLPTVKYPCPYYYLHTKELAVADAASLPVVVKDEELEELARVYVEAAAVSKREKERADQTKRAILRALDGRGKVETVGGVKISTWQQRVGRRGLSGEWEEYLRAAIMAFHGLDIDQYRSQAVATMMRPTLPRDKEREQ